MQTIFDNLTEDLKLCASSSFYSTFLEIYKPLINELSKNHSLEEKDLLELWTQHTDHMTNNLKDSFDFLKDLSGLWNGHFERLKDTKFIVKANLGSLMNKNDQVLLVHDKKLNLLVDKLRQESTEAKLDKNLADISKDLNDFQTT